MNLYEIWVSTMVKDKVDSFIEETMQARLAREAQGSHRQVTNWVGQIVTLALVWLGVAGK